MASRAPPTAEAIDRITLLDPQVVQTWCTELQCTEHELRAAVYAVGSDPEQVRRYFRRRKETPELLED
ncbi:Protein of unknown function [Polaromonas sp. JS666]|nr:Protein of unknown function [Polaromonas sp. JS666]